MSPEHLPFSKKETCLRGFVWLSGKYKFSVTFGRNKYITPYASCSESVILFLHLRTLTMALTGPEGGLLQSKIPACPHFEMEVNFETFIPVDMLYGVYKL